MSNFIVKANFNKFEKLIQLLPQDIKQDILNKSLSLEEVSEMLQKASDGLIDYNDWLAQHRAHKQDDTMESDSTEKQNEKNLDNDKGIVYVVRHGATDFNGDSKKNDRIRGWIDVPLNAQGIEEAHKAAKKLKDMEIDKIYSSDLKRALKTARIINKELNDKIIINKALRPWNLGDFQGQSLDNVLDSVNECIQDENKEVPNGESFIHFRKRYLGKLNSIIQEAKSKGINIIVVSHYRNVKAAEAWMANHMPQDLSIDSDEMQKNGIKTGEILEINTAKEHKKHD